MSQKEQIEMNMTREGEDRTIRERMLQRFYARFRRTDLVIPLAVMAALIILVVIIALFFDRSQIYHVKEDVYSFVFQDRAVYHDLTFKSTDDGVMVRENGREYGTEGYAYYYMNRDAMITSDHFCYYNVGGLVCGRVPCFSELTYKDSRIYLSSKDSRGIRGGFFHNGRDSYLLAEPGTVEVNGESYPVSAFSSVFCYRGKTITIYNYEEENKEAVYLEIDPAAGAALKLESGMSVDLRYDIYYLANGVKNLLIASPEVLDEINLSAMEDTDEE